MTMIILGYWQSHTVLTGCVALRLLLFAVKVYVEKSELQPERQCLKQFKTIDSMKTASHIINTGKWYGIK